MASTYSTVSKENEGDTNYRLYFKNEDGLVISPFHDIPLYVDKEENIFNMIVEVTRGSHHKMAIATSEQFNPIKLSSFMNVKGGCFCNYGTLPQTWESPYQNDEFTGLKGDNDPIDSFDLGSKLHRTGEVIQIKLIGCICVTDCGETDWKLLTIDANDPLVSQINDVDDLLSLKPSVKTDILFNSKMYKPGVWYFDNQFRNREFALRVVAKKHQLWKDLIAKSSNESLINLTNVSVSYSPHKITKSDQFAL